MAQHITDFVDLIFTLGSMLYTYKMTVATKGGVLERGMRLVMLSLVFLLLSIIADTISDLQFSSGVFDIAHDLILAVFILLMFFGTMTMARDASGFLKLLRLEKSNQSAHY